MTIQDTEKFLESAADWGPIEDCFPGANSPSDLDGWVHLKPSRSSDGKFLLLEAKTDRGGISQAQEIAFSDLVEQGVCWAIAVWCTAGDLTTTSHMRVWWVDGGRMRDTGKMDADFGRLRKACERFCEWAST